MIRIARERELPPPEDAKEGILKQKRLTGFAGQPLVFSHSFTICPVPRVNLMEAEHLASQQEQTV
jgi:hypothetical protein